MYIFLIILGVILGLIGTLLILALFTKKGYALQREIVINRPAEQVYDYLRHIKNQDHFNKWVMTDPNMEKIYKGTDGTVGFIYGWNGNKQAGEGEQEIMVLVPNKTVDLEVRFKRPFAAVAQTPFSLEAVSANSTKVTWGMSSNMKYPMNIMLVFMDMDKMLGKDVETSLGTLKGILEK